MTIPVGLLRSRTWSLAGVENEDDLQDLISDYHADRRMAEAEAMRDYEEDEA